MKISDEDFNELFNIETGGLELYGIVTLAVNAGLTRDDALKIVKLAEKIGKEKVKMEVKKQTESMLHWVDRI